MAGRKVEVEVGKEVRHRWAKCRSRVGILVDPGADQIPLRITSVFSVGWSPTLLRD